ncbi:MAG: hypothetical protein J6S14_11810 [Clostridia bacterium]|nr:hypothetical protein [Clostridia bacterium]
MTREQEAKLRDMLEEFKQEYAEKRGWADEEYWYGDDDRLYEAECYAYDKIAEILK